MAREEVISPDAVWYGTWDLHDLCRPALHRRRGTAARLHAREDRMAATSDNAVCSHRGLSPAHRDRNGRRKHDRSTGDGGKGYRLNAPSSDGAVFQWERGVE